MCRRIITATSLLAAGNRACKKLFAVKVFLLKDLNDPFEKALREKGIGEEKILAAVRVASLLQAHAVVLDTEKVAEGCRFLVRASQAFSVNLSVTYQAALSRAIPRNSSQQCLSPNRQRIRVPIATPTLRRIFVGTVRLPAY
jgi:hypothetical protein